MIELQAIIKKEVEKVVPFMSWELLWELKNSILERLYLEPKLRRYLEKVLEFRRVAEDNNLYHSPIVHKIYDALIFGEELEVEAIKERPEWKDLVFCYPELEDLLREAKNLRKVIQEALQDLRRVCAFEMELELEVLADDDKAFKLFAG